MEYVRRNNTNCLVCNKAIYRRPNEIKKNKGRVFCNMVCYGKINRKEKPCVICGKLILAGLNKKTCSRACANIHRTGIRYKQIGVPKKDKVANERMLKLRLFKLRGHACEICGYNKIEILHVHHKDRNHQNNNLDNLQLICPNCHYEEHHLKNSWLKEYNFKD